MHSKEFVEKMKERLLEEQERLQDELKQFGHHQEIGNRDDDNALEIEMDEVSEDIAETLRSDLKKVESALQKIETGSYGMTEDGQMIPEARLEVIPWADSLTEEK